MAAKSNCCELPNSKLEQRDKSVVEPEQLAFRIIDIFVVILSIGTFLVDLSTDVVLVVNYFLYGHMYWAVGTLLLIIVPALVVQMFSMRWHIADENVNISHWVAHILLLGILHRQVIVLKTGLEARSSGDPTDFQRLYHQQNDICMLHLFESFLESAPQLVLQLYIMVSLEDWCSLTGVSAVASLASLAWAVAAYTRAMRRARTEKLSITWPGLLLQATWRAGMLAARISSLVLFAIGFRVWIFLALGVHWLGMTTWVVFQKTDFCETPAEERIYNCVVGVIYCFCFFNLQEGRSRRRIFAFYTIIIAQNVGCVCLYITVLGYTRPDVFKVATSTIVGGTVIGMSSMLLYYRFFHPTGPIVLCGSRELGCSVENDSKSQLHPVQSGTLRSLKHLWTVGRNDSSSRLDDLPQHQAEDACSMDKKLLLMHCSAETSQPCATASNEISSSPKERARLPLPGEFTHATMVDQDGSDMLRPRRQRLPLPDEIIQSCSLSPQKSVDSPKPKRQRMPLPDEIAEPPLQNLNASSPSARQRLPLPDENVHQRLPLSDEKVHQRLSLPEENVHRLPLPDENIRQRLPVLEDAVRQRLPFPDENIRQRLPLPDENIQTSPCSTEQLGIDKKQTIENDCISNQICNVVSPSVDSSTTVNSKCENYCVEKELDRTIHRKKRRGIYSAGDIVSEVKVKVKDSEVTEDKSQVHVTVGCEGFVQNLKTCHGREMLSPDCSGEVQSAESEGAPSEILSVPSEVLSAHDYENMCAVNIAREAWGLRSWRGYSDIETWLHDDSMVRDRRRDTLTSTTSSENSARSSGSPPPIPNRHPRQEEYLDTLVYDLSVCMVDPEPDPTPGIFVARPYVVDQHGALFPLQTLDTITEELEESSSSDVGERLGRCHGSASTLVATIDEIRHGDLYNLADEQWETSTQQSQSTCEELYPPKSLLASHAQTHLLPEEILFLSKLKPLPEAGSASCSSVTSNPYTKPDSDDAPKIISHTFSSSINRTHVKSDIPVSSEFLKSLPDHKNGVSKEGPAMLLKTLTHSFSSPNTQIPQSDSKLDSVLPSAQHGRSNLALKQKPDTSFHSNYSPPAVICNKPKPVLDHSFPSSEFPPLQHRESSFQLPSPLPDSPEDSRQSGKRNRPRRKFSLIREKFETKQGDSKSSDEPQKFPSHLDISPSDTPLTAVYSEPLPYDMTAKILMESEPVVCYNKENVLPVPSRIKQWNTLLKSQNTTNLKSSPDTFQVIALSRGLEQELGKTWPGLASLKERRSMFLKQVLSPPKFSNWSRRGSVSPTSKKVPAL